MAWMLPARSASPDATRALAARLAGVARRGDVIVLQGSLGAGKTTFAQGFARGLGVEGPVTSPTFTLVRQYPCALGQLVHVDVYRLDRLAEVADLGLADLVEEGVALVEWGDAARPALGPVTWTVDITRVGTAATGTATGTAATGTATGTAATGTATTGTAAADDERLLTVHGEDDARRGEVASAWAGQVGGAA